MTVFNPTLFSIVFKLPDLIFILSSIPHFTYFCTLLILSNLDYILAPNTLSVTKLKIKRMRTNMVYSVIVLHVLKMQAIKNCPNCTYHPKNGSKQRLFFQKPSSVYMNFRNFHSLLLFVPTQHKHEKPQNYQKTSYTPQQSFPFTSNFVSFTSGGPLCKFSSTSSLQSLLNRKGFSSSMEVRKWWVSLNLSSLSANQINLVNNPRSSFCICSNGGN